ncbi:MAG: hypothetical protein HYZ34_03780 [Ignavibacteriae bacterium]|nr:hypothetical protein [Ignavibacteriota bacterium]
MSQILPFKTYSVKDGLLSNDIEAISQDTRGYIWFGTSDGISVFDGRSFINYTTNEGLPHNFIMQILPDKMVQETMWILAGGIVSKFFHGRFTTIKLNSSVISLYQDNQGRIWCATDSGAVILDGDSITTFQPPFLSRGYKEMVEIGDSTIWFALDRSLIYYSKIHNTFKSVNISSAYYETFHSMKKDDENNLWVTKGWGGILQIRDTTIISEREGYTDKEFEQFGSNLYDVQGERVWTFGYNGITGMLKSKLATSPALNYSIVNGLQENTIRSGFMDREENLWIGGRDKGVAKLSRWNILRFPLGSVWFVHHHQFAVADSNNHLWVIANEKLTEIWKDRLGVWHTFVHEIPRADSLILPDVGGSRVFNSLFYDSKGKLWLSSIRCPGSVECYDIFTDSSLNGDEPSQLQLVKTVWVGKEFANAQMRIFCFIVDKKDALWVSIANGGIAHYDTKDKSKFIKLYDEPELKNYIRTLFEDKEGNIWAGSFNTGLFKLTAENIPSGTFQQLTTSDGLPDDAIREIQQDRYGRIMIGTSNGGFATLEDNSIKIFTSKNGLPSNKIFSITEDSLGKLWLATSVGMVYEDTPGSKHFLKRQPFIGSSALSCGTTKSGLLWFVTATDLIVYDYLNETTDTTSPQVHITNVKVNGTSQELIGSMEFPHDKNNLEISFIGISFKDENAIRYKYRFLHQDNGWHEPTYNNSISIGHLVPGSYIFQVKAISVSGIESTTSAIVSFTILPPFWQRWWFYGSMIAGIALMIWTMYRLKINRMRREQLASQEFSRQLIESQEAERRRVAGELHDGLGQELIMIMNRSLLALKAQTMEKAKEQLDEISQTTSRAIEDVRGIAYDLSPYHLEQLGLTDSIRTMVEKMAGLSVIQFSIDIDPVDSLFTKNLEINVYRIVQECVNNIIKHSQATEADIFIKNQQQKLEIFARDNGRGFEVLSNNNEIGKQKGFGLASLSKRVKIMNGTLSIVSSTGKGTSVKIIIPQPHSNSSQSI